MEKLRAGVFMLFVLLEPVSCTKGFFTEPIICYFLDGILIIYCIVATAFFFKEKFSHIPSAADPVSENDGGIYQELERPMDADPYQVLEPSKKKKKAGKKKRSESTNQPEETDPYESLITSAPPPPPQ
ncbi:T-cell surface glycoprotein CD3 zeta chain-like protein [Lates japonicus]|uniref:T-cell surface glycoprotein CD3 zeta chain-like protein n=1 Tax=Lates japonicus TaxID=270547 RepID=A0AAD3ME61_LATJO|nr:T-cell surface glycoprotein CD3 zeta chain-like protein [Lates japonicus]